MYTTLSSLTVAWTALVTAEYEGNFMSSSDTRRILAMNCRVAGFITVYIAQGVWQIVRTKAVVSAFVFEISQYTLMLEKPE